MSKKTEPRYCPKCNTRYTYEASECVTCAVALTDVQPRDESFFKPKIDLPALLLAALFIFYYGSLPGEAQSFGLIALVVGFAALAASRAIGYSEWLGRR